MTKRKTVVQIYKAKDGWRWRMKSGNGRIIADSGEAYSREIDCSRAFYHNLSALVYGFVVRQK